MTQPARALARAAALVLAATALAAAPAVLTAQPPQGGGGRGGAAMQNMLFEGITLSDAQQVQLDSVRASFRAQNGGQGGQRAAGAAPDSAAMAARRERMTAERTALRAVLTAEQQLVFDKNVQQMEARMRQMRAQRGAPPR
jgi:Spy/CpxP family protein refolding chaperone